MIKKAIASFCAIVLLSGYCYAKPAKYDISAKTPVHSAVRSLIIPGWGQCFNEQKTKGYIIGCAALVTLAGSSLLYTKANNTYNDYENAGLKNGPIYSDYQNQQNQAMIVSFVCAGVWIYGIIDAYINGKDTVPSAQSTSIFSVACNKNKAGLYFSQKF